jgi:hypothetical protein
MHHGYGFAQYRYNYRIHPYTVYLHPFSDKPIHWHVFLEEGILWAIGGCRRACPMAAIAGIRENITVFWDHDGFPLPEVSCSAFQMQKMCDHCERWRELETETEL